MFKKLFFALWALAALISSPALAQGTWVGTGPKEVIWDTSTPWTPPIPPDSPHPYNAFEPPAVEGPQNSAVWRQDNYSQFGQSGEFKFRTQCPPTFTAKADPGLFPGRVNMGHLHTFFGPVDPYVIKNIHKFNYTMARNHPASGCQGGPLNSTAYWEPSILKYVRGLLLTVMPEHATFYYSHHPDQASQTTRLPRDLAFIGGANPADFNDQAKRNEYAAAGLLYPGSPVDPAGKLGIACYPTALDPSHQTPVPVYGAHRMQHSTGLYYQYNARYSKGPGNANPWRNPDTGINGCTAGTIIIQVDAPTCINPGYLRSPDLRSHVRYASGTGDGSWGGCPKNFVLTLGFATKIEVKHDGWDKDLQYWFFSSDRMNPPDTPADPTSLDPCRATGPFFCNMATAHFDWWGAWRDPEITLFQQNCGGLTINGSNGAGGGDCGSAGLGPNKNLTYSANTGVPDPSIQTYLLNTKPAARASSSIEGQKYFPVDPKQQVQGVLTVGHEGHSAHH